MTRPCPVNGGACGWCGGWFGRSPCTEERAVRMLHVIGSDETRLPHTRRSAPDPQHPQHEGRFPFNSRHLAPPPLLWVLGHPRHTPGTFR
jgi:hypothetical protein